MKIIIYTSGFIFGVMFIIAVYNALNYKKMVVLSRIKKYTQFHSNQDVDEFENNKEKIGFSYILKVLGKAFAARSFTKKVENQLLKANIPMRGEEFIVINLIAAIFFFIIGYLIMKRLSFSIILSTFGFVIPAIIVHRKKKEKLEKINQNISECITIISNSLRAGYSFQQAVDLVSKETSGALAAELKKTILEINLGTTLEDALLNLNDRVESDDLELMITAILIQRQIGGNLSEILDNISYTIRERIRVKGEIKTLTAQGRTSGLIIGLLPPILFVALMLINPSYIGILLQRKIGLIILGSGIISEILGLILIKKIVNIEV